MNLEGIDGFILTLRQCARSHIYTVAPFVPIDAQTMRERNRGIVKATVAYVGLDAPGVIGVTFHI